MMSAHAPATPQTAGYAMKILILLLQLTLLLWAPGAAANTLYISAINRYQAADTVVFVYPKNLSPGVHNAASNTNNPFGCEFSGPSFSGTKTMVSRVQPVYQVPVTVTYKDGSSETPNALLKGAYTHYISDGYGNTQSCSVSYPTFTVCEMRLSSSNTYFKSSGWEGASFFLEVPKKSGGVVQSMAIKSGFNALMCQNYTADGYSGYSTNNYLQGQFVDGGAFNYDPGNTCTLSLSATNMTLPATTVTQASAYSVNASFGSTQTVNAQINCSVTTALGMKITIGNSTQALNASNTDGIMKNTAAGAANGVSVKLSFGTISGSSGSPSWSGSAVRYGTPMDLINGKNVTVPIVGQLVRTGATLTGGNIGNAFTVSVQYD